MYEYRGIDVSKIFGEDYDGDIFVRNGWQVLYSAITRAKYKVILILKYEEIEYSNIMRDFEAYFDVNVVDNFGEFLKKQ